MKIHTKRFGLLLLSSLLLVSVPVSLASSDRFELRITNQSDQVKTSAIVPLDLPDTYQNRFVQVVQGQKTLPSYLSEDKKRLYLQTDIGANEEISFHLSFSNKASNQVPLQPSTLPGTKYLMVNYAKAIIISTQDQNNIKIQSTQNELLENKALQKGEMHILTSSTPQLIKIDATYPVFVYMSSIKNSGAGGANFEEGDSDTTSLYGSDIFFFTHRHLWISAYEDSEISVFDQNGLPVWEGKLSKNTGLPLLDLKEGVYHLVSNQAVSVQFGYLDDENFSFIYGKSTQTNGFSFGDLLITALHPETQIELSFQNPKKQQKKINLKQAGFFELVPLVEVFSPKEPEAIFFTLTSNKPILLNTFSSGTNFGGDFVPGLHGLFTDTTFQFVTPKISKEFSKEQKNMIELLGLHPQSSVLFSNTIQQELLLQADTSFNLLSQESLAWVQINSNQQILASQLHNYTQKGLFMWVPPILDHTLQANIGKPATEGIFESTTSSNIKKTFWDPYRFKEFYTHFTSKEYLPYTIFSVSLFLLFLIVLLYLLFAYKPKESKSQVFEKEKTTSKSEGAQESELFMLMNDMEQKMNQNIQLQETLEAEKIPPVKTKEDDTEKTSFPKLNTSYDDWISRLKENAKQSPVLPGSTSEIPAETPPADQTPESKPKNIEIDLPFLDVDHTKSSEEVSISRIEKSKVLNMSKKTVVLDPGSANRLYFEGVLDQFHQALMVRSSAKRLQADVAKHLQQVDLNAQDLSRAQLFQERLETLEEAGKALALCKKKRIAIYITSYRLPPSLQKIQIMHVADLIKES
ncbi:MAG TPA: hypothetical protein PK581_04075 [Caldisericia bacterium]|nr:hypothetical protein [Caldisericia bacterium]